MPVASAEAPILAMLLPSSSAPIIRSRIANRLETTPASRLPCFDSRNMLAREAPVSAVSLAEKNAEISRQPMTIENVSQSMSDIHFIRRRKIIFSESGMVSASFARQFARKKIAHQRGSTSGAITARPTASSRMKVSRPRLTFLSCAISAISASASAKPFLGKSGDVLQMGRQTDRGKVMLDARRVRSAIIPSCAENSAASTMPTDDAFAVEQPIGKSGRGFQRMAESMAEIEQRAFAGLALVARHDRRLGAARGRDGVFARGAAGEDVGMVGLEPGEEGLVAEHAIFGDFGVAGAELARRQRVEHGRVGDHQHRLMKGAEQIFAVRRIDPGLAADGRVDLRQQRGRHLHEIDAAAQDRRRKAGEIADHAAAERDHQIVALDLGRDQRFADLFEAGIGFEPSPSSTMIREVAIAGRRQRGFGFLKPIFGNVAVGDDGGARARPQGGERAPGDGSTSRPMTMS